VIVDLKRYRDQENVVLVSVLIGLKILEKLFLGRNVLVMQLVLNVLLPDDGSYREPLA